MGANDNNRQQLHKREKFWAKCGFFYPNRSRLTKILEFNGQIEVQHIVLEGVIEVTIGFFHYVHQAAAIAESRLYDGAWPHAHLQACAY